MTTSFVFRRNLRLPRLARDYVRRFGHHLDAGWTVTLTLSAESDAAETDDPVAQLRTAVKLWEMVHAEYRKDRDYFGEYAEPPPHVVERFEQASRAEELAHGLVAQAYTSLTGRQIPAEHRHAPNAVRVLVENSPDVPT